MTDKQILKTLENIKKNCAKHKFCNECAFHLSDGACQINLVLETLGPTAPFLWKLDKTEAVLKKS